MNAFVFPGQGSQRKGMGEELFDEFAELTQLADDILGYSIKELCLDNPDQKLNKTQYTQTAMYVVNAFSFLKRIKDTGKTPDFLAGHSLGEYNALHAAGVFSFENGLKLVKKRGELMSQAREGGMAAILNSSENHIRQILEDANLATIDIANHNAPSQIVISGLKEDINKSQPFFEKANAMFIPLNTSGAFHSRYMKDAEAEFRKYVKKFKFSKPQVPVIANVTAKPYESEIAQNLIQQITSCVRWTDSVMFLLNQGVTEFEEIGVGDVLTKLVDYTRKVWKSDIQNTQSQIDQNSKSTDDPTVETSLKNEGSEPQNAKARPTTIWPNESLTAQEMVELWNKTFPVATKVSSELYDTELETRTEAMVLFGHRAAVYMKGYNGYFDLREVTPR